MITYTFDNGEVAILIAAVSQIERTARQLAQTSGNEAVRRAAANELLQIERLKARLCKEAGI